MSEIKAWERVVVVVGFCVIATAAHGQPIVGEGEWQSLSSAAIKGGWTASLVREGGRVTGTFALTNSNVLSGGSVSGSIDASSVILGVGSQGTRHATFSGQLDGGSVTGEWNLDSDVLKDHGVWYGTLNPVPGGAAAQ